MVRSLYSGISGLRTHQVGLDVTANNIANVNTVAFKAGRATFKESMVQMLAGPSRPAGNQGGRNPMQVGLGVAVGSIDTMLRQGNLQTTGQITDLALEGRAYFAFSNGSGTFYSRNGGLQLDSSGHLVSPTNGWRLQGKMARADGTYGPDAMIGDIRIPWGEKSPAKATDLMTLACNLNSDSHALGTVTHTNRFLTSAERLNDGDYRLAPPDHINGTYLPAGAVDDPANYVPYGNLQDPANIAGIEAYQRDFEAYLQGAQRSKLTDLFDENGNSLGIVEGDTLTFRVADPNVETFSFRVEKYEVTNEATGEVMTIMPTLQDFIDHLDSYLDRIMPGDNGVTVGIGKNGGLSIVNNSGEDIVGLQVSSSRPGSKAFVANAFLFPSTIGTNRDTDLIGNPAYTPGMNDGLSPGDPGYVEPMIPNPDWADRVNYTTPGLRIAAAAEDALGALFDAAGRPLGFTDGDTININGLVGGRNKNNSAPDDMFTFYDGRGQASQDAGRVDQPTTMLELLTAISEAYGLPPTDGTQYQRQSIQMKTSADLVSDGIPIGAIVIRGQPELAFALTGLSIIGKQADPNQQNAPTRFNTNMTFTEVQTARNTGVWPTSTIVYDESGAQHNVTMTFTHSGTPGEWLWEISMSGGDQVILGGNRGRVTFALDGSPSSFTFDDYSNEFRFDPRNGANEVAIKLDVGGPGMFTGITQFDSESTTAITGQNGYPMGKLQEISIGENGEISGIYTNGISKSLAIIYVAEFNNPAGLLKMGDSMFNVSNNSGEAALYQPGVGSTTKIKPGAIEMSNVELETEFTNMITIQRGYQASARVVSTSDQMLQELVQLVR